MGAHGPSESYDEEAVVYREKERSGGGDTEKLIALQRQEGVGSGKVSPVRRPPVARWEEGTFVGTFFVAP